MEQALFVTIALFNIHNKIIIIITSTIISIATYYMSQARNKRAQKPQSAIL
jgi:hypothetical protein